MCSHEATPNGREKSNKAYAKTSEIPFFLQGPRGAGTIFLQLRSHDGKRENFS
jgi:hypothetical protein